MREMGGADKKGCSRCGKSRCQVCNVMNNSEHFHSNIDSREYRINYSFNCDSSNVVYLLECTICGVQYVGSTCTPFRLRFNKYKACSRKLNAGTCSSGLVPAVLESHMNFDSVVYNKGK